MTPTCSNTFKLLGSKLQGLLACHPNEVEPKSKEAIMINALSMHNMCSWNFLTRTPLGSGA